MERILLTKKEVFDLATFSLEHDHGAIIIESSGGSGIANNITVICGTCLKEQDISDYGSW
jgi:hypothetical protein